MMKIALLIVLLFTASVFAKSDKIPEEKSEVGQIVYPSIEVSAGIGFMWLVQTNLTLSPEKHLYLQPRFSTSFLASEVGFVVGYQTDFRDHAILRIGLGYSKGQVTPIDPGGSTVNDDDRWSTIYIRIGLLNRISESTTINPNINIIRGEHKTIFSLNVNYVIIIL
jgi:hypothetical protein